MLLQKCNNIHTTEKTLKFWSTVPSFLTLKDKPSKIETVFLKNEYVNGSKSSIVDNNYVLIIKSNMNDIIRITNEYIQESWKLSSLI